MIARLLLLSVAVATAAVLAFLVILAFTPKPEAAPTWPTSVTTTGKSPLPSPGPTSGP